MFLEKTLESPLDCKEIKPVNPKGNQSGMFTGSTYAEAEAPILWPPDAKNRLIRKDPEARKDWRQEEKGTTEDETVGWHHLLDGQELEQSTGVSDGQGSLAQRVRHDWATELIFVYIFVYDLVRLNPTDCESILFRNSVSLVQAENLEKFIEREAIKVYVSSHWNFGSKLLFACPRTHASGARQGWHHLCPCGDSSCSNERCSSWIM